MYRSSNATVDAPGNTTTVHMSNFQNSGKHAWTVIKPIMGQIRQTVGIYYMFLESYGIETAQKAYQLAESYFAVNTQISGYQLTYPPGTLGFNEVVFWCRTDGELYKATFTKGQKSVSYKLVNEKWVQDTSERTESEEPAVTPKSK
jgi:hypothetical protein